MADDGQKFLPISDGMAKDLDSGKAAGRDIADFLPDDVAQEIYDASHPGPVHAENLIPISRQQGAEMRMIDPEAGTLPRFPATRRVIPAPFQRDRVVGGKHGKKWILATAEQVRKGDIIPDLGLVVEVVTGLAHSTVAEVAGGAAGEWAGDAPVATGTEVTVTGAGGKVAVWPAGREVKVFR